MLGLGWWAALYVEAVLYCDQPSNELGPFLKPPEDLRCLAPYVNEVERGFYRSEDGLTNWPELRYHVRLDRDRLAELLAEKLNEEPGWLFTQGSNFYRSRDQSSDYSERGLQGLGWHERGILGATKKGADGRLTLILWGMTETWGWTDLFVRDYSVSYSPAQIRVWRQFHGPHSEPKRLRVKL